MKEIEISGRKFRLVIPSAWDGCAIFDMESAYKVPFGLGNVLGLKSVKQSMPPEQLEIFMKLCLKNCYEIKETGDIHVVDEDGGIGILDATAPLLTKLTAQFIVFFMEYWQTESL